MPSEFKVFMNEILSFRENGQYPDVTVDKLTDFIETLLRLSIESSKFRGYA